MTIHVQLRTRSEAIIARNVTAINCHTAAKRGLKPITEPQLATSIDGATFIANTYLRMFRAGIPCAIVHTYNGKKLTVYRAGVVTCEQLMKREEKTLRRHLVRRDA